MSVPLLWVVWQNIMYLCVRCFQCRVACWTGRSNYNTINISQSKHIVLRSGRRGRPNSIQTLILILRAPWSLYSHSTRIRYNLTHYLSWKRKEGSIWKPRNNLCYNSNWIARIHSMITPHIYSRNGCWHTSPTYQPALKTTHTQIHDMLPHHS
jgi:hypothetical protein